MSNYFSKIPDFEYVSRLKDAKISDYEPVKNLFKRAKIREDIFQDLAFFTKYDIKGDDRPDNVAFELYGDSSLDWIILVSNNILNIQSEWPLTQKSFDQYLLEKYGDYNTLYNGIHHYETTEVKNSNDVVIVPAGLQVDSDQSFTYLDNGVDKTVNPVIKITNYQYEEKLENEKRNIFVLKPRYLNVVIDDLEEMMAYQKGSTQYVSETLKKADNIRIYT